MYKTSASGPSIWKIYGKITFLLLTISVSISASELSEVGKLAEAVFNERTKTPWFVCGKRLTEEQEKEESARVAYKVIQERNRINTNIDVYGIVATMINESGLDRCAIGRDPRNWAIAKNIIKPSRQSISVPEERVLAAVRHKNAARAFPGGFDLGLCQILHRFYDGDPADMLALNSGIRICVLEMNARAQFYRTNEPWYFWRGGYKKWYGDKIERIIRRLRK